MAQLTRRQLTIGALAAASQTLAGNPGAIMSESFDPGLRSATDLIDALAAGSVGAEELARHYVNRIERFDSALNAVVVRDFERAIGAARAADAARAQGRPVGPLAGLPVTVKESFDVMGLPTTWGDPAARHNVAESDAVVVERLRRAGATLLGKTNVPLHISDFQTYNGIYGQTNNPWDPARTPGGSSGGSAAAVAAGLTGFGFGSDLGGSVRNPAHFCGVYSHKPTWGIVPFRSQTYPGAPNVPQELDMAVAGPIARSADDLELALELTTGPDELAAGGWRLSLPRPRRTGLREFRVAVWPDDSMAPVDAGISGRVARLADELARLGATVSDTARPGFDKAAAWQTYRSLVLALSGGDDPVSYPRWLELHLERGRYRQQWQAFFEDWDVLITPVTSTTAFPHDHGPVMSRTLIVNGAPRGYFEHVFWTGLATLSYLPATVFPTGVSQSGLPIGLQAVGAEFADHTTIQFARLAAHAFGGFVPPPGYTA